MKNFNKILSKRSPENYNDQSSQLSEVQSQIPVGKLGMLSATVEQSCSLSNSVALDQSSDGETLC